MIGPITRIIARYISGAMVTYGFFTETEIAQLHPDVVMIVGIILAAGVEMTYRMAKRMGWAT